ncbi:MAG: RidA family protein [Acidimicrobiia bacterium]
MSRHHLFNPDHMAPAAGFSYGAVAAEGRTLHIAGLTGHRRDLSIDEGIVDQFSAACRAVAGVIEEAGGEPTDLVSMTIYTSAIEEYRQHLQEIGLAYRMVFGKHYPPMALLGISELFDPKALVELVCVAVVPTAS